MTFCQTIIIEIIKILVIGLILYLIKEEIVKRNKKKEKEKLEKELENEFKTVIVDEFITIFSNFYEIRKNYHSTFITNNKALNSESKEQLKVDCLLKSSKFEGHYGALKVRLTNHYNLPKGSWETTNIDLLKQQVINENDFFKKLRLRLDLLGEYYDIWRNSIEEGVKIKAEGDLEFYELYNDILNDLNYRKIIIPKGKKV